MQQTLQKSRNQGGFLSSPSRRQALFAAVAFLISVAPLAAVEKINETFNDWPHHSSIQASFSTNGWLGTQMRVGGAEAFNDALAEDKAVYLNFSGSPTLRTPLLTNGVGSISFDSAIVTASRTFPFDLQISTNGSTWATIAAYTNVTGLGESYNWTNRTFVIDNYDDVYLRFLGYAPTGGGTLLGIDNVVITEAPVFVTVGEPSNDPAVPFEGDPVDIEIEIEPSALVTDLAATVHYDAQSGTGSIGMTNISANLWRTITPIPAQDQGGFPVLYDIEISFNGPFAQSPVFTNGFYTVSGYPPASSYTSMQVIGTETAAMELVADEQWQAVLTLPTPTTGLSFQFEGLHTNLATHTWGDNIPASTNLIVQGTGAIGQTAIKTGSLPAGQIAFSFQSDTGTYELNDAVYQDFEDWTDAESPGTYTNAGWILQSGWVTNGVGDAVRGSRSAVLEPTGTSALQTPERPGGIGTISFWIRNWEADALPVAAAAVQVSADATDWRTIHELAILPGAYMRVVVPFNSRTDHFVRIVNTLTDVPVLVDDVLVASPGAGLILSNLAHSPAGPSATDSVQLSVNVSPQRGAATGTLTAYWRLNETGDWTAINMSNTGGSTWTTDNNVPAANTGGFVEYYVRATFSGYQAAAGSPAFKPPAGIEAPASYPIVPANIQYTNVVTVPAQPLAGSTFSLRADIIPIAGATDRIATFFYRTGSSGPFSQVSMTNVGTNRFETSLPITMPTYPGTPLQYYIRTTFLGFNAQTPRFYPDAGPNGPAFIITVPAPYPSAFTNMVVSGDFSGSLRLTAPHQWHGVISLSGTINDPAFTIEGSGPGGSRSWGDNEAAAADLPLFGTAATNQNPIAIAGSHQGNFLLAFNASNGLYRLQAVTLQDFESFPLSDSFTPGEPVSTNGWSILNATIFNTNANFSGHSLRLGGANAASTNSYVLSPPLPEGAGSISFFYRNLDETGTRPGRVEVQTRSAANSLWKTTGTLTNILTTTWLYAQFPHASETPDTEVRLLWESEANPLLSHIAIDNLLIEQPGVLVTVTNMAHTPLGPTVTNLVTLSADLLPSAGATNLSAIAWYRAGTNGSFDATPMTHSSGNTYITSPPIPRMPEGPVQVFVETSFLDPHGNGPYTTFGPLAAEADPYTYFSDNAFAAYTEFNTNFGWTVKTTPAPAGWSGSITNAAGWLANETRISQKNWTGASFPEVGWMIYLSSQDVTNSYIQTPWMPNGVGAVKIHAGIRALGIAELLLQSSTNGVNWVTHAAITSFSTTFQDYAFKLDIDHGTYLRFFQSEAESGTRSIGIETFAVTVPLADVYVTNRVTIPFFPAAPDEIAVQADILSMREFSPATDIQAELFYRVAGETNFTGPLPMSRSGSTFTSVLIPPQPGRTTIEYYIQSTFKGYARFFTNSPALLPPDPQQNPFSFFIDDFSSAYGEVVAQVGTNTFDLVRTDNAFWEAVINITTPTNNPPLTLKGYDHFDGNTFFPGLFAIWGDNAQSGTNLPMAGFFEAGADPIIIPETARGQYLLRFDETTREYSLQRVAWQNFDTWPADANLFAESYDGDEFTIYAQDFNTWPLSSPTLRTTDFEEPSGWTNTQAFPPTDFGDQTGAFGAGFYAVRDAAIFTQVVGRAAMLINDINNGDVRLTTSQSIGTFSFDVRASGPTDTGRAMLNTSFETNIMVSANFRATEIPINSALNSVGQTYKSVIIGYKDSNNYYEARVVQSSATQRRIEFWERTGGNWFLRSTSSAIFTGSITTDDTLHVLAFRTGTNSVRFRTFLNNNTARTDWTDSTAFIGAAQAGISAMDAGIACLQFTVYEVANINHSTANPIYQKSFEDGHADGWTLAPIWYVSEERLRRNAYNGPPLGVSVDWSTDGGLNWTPLGTHTITNVQYQRISQVFHRAQSGIARARHTAGNGHLVMDNFEASTWLGQSFALNGWTATNAWVTTGATGRALELRRSRALTGARQFLRSPVATNGVALLTFDYLPITGTTNTLVFNVEYTTKSAPSSWTPFQTVTNAAEGWQSVSIGFPRNLQQNINQIEIRNTSSESAAGMLLDNVVVTEPVQVDDFTWWAYNALITDNQTNRLADVVDNVKGAYLNFAPDADTGTEVLDEFAPSIQSARLPDGIGEISFLYRAWDATPALLEIVAATNRLQPDHEWVLIDSLSVTNTAQFQTYTTYLYDRTNQYVKLRANTNATGRIALDNILITAPFASFLRLTNVRTIPEIPIYTDDVRVRVEVTDRFANPVVTNMNLMFKIGTNNWGNFSGATEIPMEFIGELGDNLVYQSFVPIPAGNQIDRIYQYQVEAAFDGFLSSAFSPTRITNFPNPDHYWPLDFNRNQPSPTPYFIALSCLPGQVWINELGIGSSWFGPFNQYIEIVGVAGANVNNWRIESIRTDWSTNATYTLSGTMPGTNDYGFLVIGDTDTPQRNITMTNALPHSGGFQLIREIGIIDEQLAYDSGAPGLGQSVLVGSPDHRYVYAGYVESFGSAPLALIDPFSSDGGSNRTDFIWSNDTGTPTIGTTNINQTLIPWPTGIPQNGGDPPYTGPLEIDAAWRSSGRVYFSVSSDSENLTLTPWYTTNLMAIAWQQAPNPTVSRTGTTYTVGADLVPARAFYKVTATGTE